jgi:hypothetical protein
VVIPSEGRASKSAGGGKSSEEDDAVLHFDGFMCIF